MNIAHKFWLSQCFLSSAFKLRSTEETFRSFSSAQLESSELLPSHLHKALHWVVKADCSVIFFNFCLTVSEQSFVTCLWERKKVREEDRAEGFTLMALMVRAAFRYRHFCPFPGSAMAHWCLRQFTYPFQAHAQRDVCLKNKANNTDSWWCWGENNV